MICPKCNEKVALDEKICPKYGAEIEEIYKKKEEFLFVCFGLLLVVGWYLY